jgi:hypothetical protein
MVMIVVLIVIVVMVVIRRRNDASAQNQCRERHQQKSQTQPPWRFRGLQRKHSVLVAPPPPVFARVIVSRRPTARTTSPMPGHPLLAHRRFPARRQRAVQRIT